MSSLERKVFIFLRKLLASQKRKGELCSTSATMSLVESNLPPFKFKSIQFKIRIQQAQIEIEKNIQKEG